MGEETRTKDLDTVVRVSTHHPGSLVREGTKQENIDTNLGEETRQKTLLPWCVSPRTTQGKGEHKNLSPAEKGLDKKSCQVPLIPSISLFSTRIKFLPTVPEFLVGGYPF